MLLASVRLTSALEILKSCTRSKIVLKTFELKKEINAEYLTDVIIDCEFDHDIVGNYRYF